MGITYLASGCMLDKSFGSVNFTPPATYYVGLSTTNIYASGSGATEPSGANYARVGVTNDKSGFTYASSGCLVNAGAIEFPESSGSWGTITYIGVWDASTSGNVWFYNELPSAKIVQSDTIVSFSASAVSISIT